MEVYFDNSATTVLDPDVLALMSRVMLEDYGNAASLHKKGVEAERYIRAAKEQIAATLKCDTKEIYFTSGGTESNNWALIGTAYANRRAGTHLVTTLIEHPSVKNTMKFLEENGFSVTWLPVDENGLVTAEDVKNALRPDTILVSVMYVNNEIGAVEPIAEIGEMLKRTRPDVLFHTDAIQAYGKYRIYPKRMNIDLLSVSGHKLHGPKGTGFLYISDRTKIRPLIYGGGQQKGLRSGTENVPGDAGLGLAAEKAYRDLDRNTAQMREVKDYMIRGLSGIPGTHLNGRTDETSAPHILSASFDNVRSEVLLHALEERGVCVSSGSACASSHPSEINTLLGIGLPKERQEGTIRFSFNEANTREEAAYVLDALREILPMLRRFVRR
ncbi:MAG: cysteine desulfurase [Lachnospiraceae bacterium]|nr:cysteine desulfurase [Lachnospiraceae bacterium]